MKTLERIIRTMSADQAAALRALADAAHRVDLIHQPATRDSAGVQSCEADRAVCLRMAATVFTRTTDLLVSLDIRREKTDRLTRAIWAEASFEEDSVESKVMHAIDAAIEHCAAKGNRGLDPIEVLRARLRRDVFGR